MTEILIIICLILIALPPSWDLSIKLKEKGTWGETTSWSLKTHDKLWFIIVSSIILLLFGIYKYA